MKKRLPSHQTVKLARGKHSSPRDGVCVMELASMLSGEGFSDRPYCVSPAIAGFLRAYNDFIDDGLRQDLFRLASAVVGTRGSPEIEQMRVRRVFQWGQSLRRPRPWSKVGTCRHSFCARRDDLNPDDAAAFAVRGIGRKRTRAHAEALALVDELVACGQREETGAQQTVEQWLERKELEPLA
jgi:hypothetical protein